MPKSMKKIHILAVLIISTVSSLYAQMSVETEEYYRLGKLTQASPPKHVRMVKISNMISSRSVVSEGILFTYKNRSARDVHISGNFSDWRPRKMDRGRNGVWYFLLDDYEGKDTVRYKFCVDGTWIFDPSNEERIDDRAGSYLSLAEPYPKSEGRHVTYRGLDDGRIEFRYFRPAARSVSLVGDFNHWNPEQDLLRKGKDGIWRTTKRLHAGTYRYRYLIDGTAAPDLYNPRSASDDAGDLCSLLRVE
jgi:1,4-alpha-glucan branching enzyme